MVKDIILSLSGGLDSSSLLFEYKDRIALAVSFKYPSNHNERELKRAKDVSKHACVDYHVVDLTGAFWGFNSALLEGAGAVPNAEYNKETISKLIVPFRNGIFLSVLAGLADSRGCEYIALANHAGDHEVYPDCRPEFSSAMGLAIYKGTSNGVQLFCPYVNLSKGEIAYRGIKAGLKPEWTYSCYKGKKVPCGKCPTCIERQEALDYAYKKLQRSK